LKVLVIGSGGREFAIAWKLAQSQKVTELLIAPGNAGTAELGENVEVKAEDVTGLFELAQSRNVDLTIVGPEQPLVDGIVDRFQEAGLKIFGPSAGAARLEGSKVFSDGIMTKYGIPTAESVAFSDSGTAIEYGLGKPEGSLVVKADGLAAGKGVLLSDSHEQLTADISAMLDGKAFGEASAEILLAERLTGPEVSVFAFLDGSTVSNEVAACDYKRIGEGDTGLNTGGVGSYTPPEFWNDDLAKTVRETVLQPMADAMVAEGCPYTGVLYAGLMVTPQGPKVIEFNCRFGDPECEILMPRLKTDLVDVCMAVAEGRLSDIEVEWSDDAYAFVFMTADGYPGSYETGLPITGTEDASEHGVVIHAGTALTEDGSLITSGGRVIGVVGSGADIGSAREAAYKGVDAIEFTGARVRRDIAERAL